MSKAPERYTADEDRVLAQACRDYLDCGTAADVAVFAARLRALSGELHALMGALQTGTAVEVMHDAAGYRVRVQS